MADKVSTTQDVTTAVEWIHDIPVRQLCNLNHECS